MGGSSVTIMCYVRDSCTNTHGLTDCSVPNCCKIILPENVYWDFFFFWWSTWNVFFLFTSFFCQFCAFPLIDSWWQHKGSGGEDECKQWRTEMYLTCLLELKDTRIVFRWGTQTDVRMTIYLFFLQGQQIRLGDFGVINSWEWFDWAWLRLACRTKVICKVPGADFTAPPAHYKCARTLQWWFHAWKRNWNHSASLGSDGGISFSPFQSLERRCTVAYIQYLWKRGYANGIKWAIVTTDARFCSWSRTSFGTGHYWADSAL